MSRQMDRIMRDAVTEGLIGLAAASSRADERHWSVMAFTAFGAWLAAIPLIGLVLGVGFLAGASEVIGVLIGVPMLAASLLVLREGRAALFVEQVGVPSLLTGAGLVAFQTTTWTESVTAGLGMLLAVAVAVVALVPRAWIRTLMGAAIGVLAASILLSLKWPLDLRMPPSLPWSLVACGWLALQFMQRSLVLNAENAGRMAALESMSSGVAAAALAGTIWSGPTFLLGDMSAHWFGNLARGGDGDTMRVLSTALAVGGVCWLARCWPVLRTVWYAALLVLCALLAWCLPALGAAVLILCVCVESKRYALAAFAGVATVWLVGGFYYVFELPLADKALLLGSGGILAALIGRYAIAAPAPLAEPVVEPMAEPHARPMRLDSRTRAGFVLCGLLVLGVANAAIWQKEQLIRTGTAVYMELAPADPRSLMQGDYMRLRFALPWRERKDADQGPFIPQVVAVRDARGVARLARFHDGQALAKGEFLIDLIRRNGEWVFVTDAWYFKEGESERWSKARYGEFRVQPDGKALLVGLRGPKLEAL